MSTPSDPPPDGGQAGQDPQQPSPYTPPWGGNQGDAGGPGGAGAGHRGYPPTDGTPTYGHPGYGPPTYGPPGYGPPGYGAPVPGYAAAGAPGYPGYQQFDPVTGEPLSDKTKLVAGLLGIFLGGFGVGRFYIGDNTTGVLQLVVTILTCGLGSLWGLIDGILILVNGGHDGQGRKLRDQ